MKSLDGILGGYGNRHDPRAARALTDLIWYGSVRLGFALLACAVLFGAWALWNASGQAAAPASDIPASGIDRQGLSAELSALSAHASAYQALIKAPSAVSDPKEAR